MAKESPNSPYNKLLFRETFRSEAETRKQASSVTDVDFSNGVASFNGTSSKVNYNLGLNGTYSVRVRIKQDTLSSNNYLIDCRGSNDDGSGNIFIQSTNSEIIAFSATAIYVDGSTSTDGSVLDTWKEIVVTGIPLTQGTGANQSLIGARYSDSSYFDGDMDLFEIYQGTLTAEEVANLYNNTWNKELSPNNLLLDFDSTRGTLNLGDLTDSATTTDVSIKKIGQSYSAEFNGSSSKIDTWTDMIGTKAVTMMGWINPYGWGESSQGRILDNGKLLWFFVGGDTRFYSEGVTFSTSGAISLNKWQFVSVTRESDGTTNFYIGDKDTAPALSGDADQDSGTPTAGTTNVIIGNNDVQTRTFDGNISELKVYEGILSLQDITKYWSESRKNYI